jgi:hypothetical protein
MKETMEHFSQDSWCSNFELSGISQMLDQREQLGPFGTSATNWPTVPAPGDYEDGEIGGMIIGRGSTSTRRKPAPVPLCPPQTPHAELTPSEMERCEHIATLSIPLFLFFLLFIKIVRIVKLNTEIIKLWFEHVIKIKNLGATHAGNINGCNDKCHFL